MNLREFLRDQWTEYIRKFLIKNKCEECEETEKLELHHASERFEDLLMETLRELKLKEKDTNEYTNKELEMIDNIMLGKQLKIEHKTLCKIHHKKAHEEDKTPNIFNSMGGYFFVDISALKKEGMSPSVLPRYIRLASSMDYNNKLEGKYVQDALGMNMSEVLDLVEHLKKEGFIKISKHVVHFDEKFVKKGTCKFNERNVFSVKNYNSVYDKMKKNHEALGRIIYANAKREQMFNRKIFSFNKAELKKLRETLMVKTKGLKVIFNPSVVVFETHRMEELKEIYENF